jgi:hypothetical protein
MLHVATRRPVIVAAVFDAHGDPYKQPRHPVVKYGLIAFVAAVVTVAVSLAVWKEFRPKSHVQGASTTPQKSADRAANKGIDTGNTADEPKSPATQKVARRPNNGIGMAVGAIPIPRQNPSATAPSTSSPAPQNPPATAPKSAYVEVGEALANVTSIEGNWRFTTGYLMTQRERQFVVPSLEKSREELHEDATTAFLVGMGDATRTDRELWEKLVPQIDAAVNHALEFMSQTVPKLTPHQLDDERKNYADAKPPLLDTPSDISNLHDGKVKEDKYEPMVKYLTALHKKLADYPENP